MTVDTQTRLFNEFVETQRSLLMSKGKDYANADVLSNFKKVGTIIGKDAMQAVLGLIATKIVRFENLISKGLGSNPNHESIADTLIDLANYSFLAHCIYQEFLDSLTKTATKDGPMDNELCDRPASATDKFNTPYGNGFVHVGKQHPGSIYLHDDACVQPDKAGRRSAVVEDYSEKAKNTYAV